MSIAWGVAAIATLAAVAEWVWPRLGAYWSVNPLRLEVLASVVALLATYLVVNVILARYESERWRGASGPALQELRTAANALDGHVFAWCLSYAQRRGLDLPSKNASREQRNEFVKWHLRKTCEAADSYDAKDDTVASFSRDVAHLRETYRGWSTMLILSRGLQGVAVQAPALLNATESLVRAIAAYASHFAEGGDSVVGARVIPLWRAYEQQRRELVELLDKEARRPQR